MTATLTPLLSAQEAMAVLGVGRTFLTEHAAELGGRKVGRLLKFATADLAAYLERQRVQGSDPDPREQRAPTPLRAVRPRGRGDLNPVTRRPWEASR